MTFDDLIQALPRVSALNAWCRAPYEDHLGMREAVSAVYQMKQRAIIHAIRYGAYKWRLVSVTRPCKACKGTGTYEWVNWHDEDDRDYQDCRRCGATGKVELKFVETEILGHRWHTPRPKADFFTNTLGFAFTWDKTEPTEWEPEQPGRVLSRSELIRHLNEAERYVYPGKLLRTTYPLHFGLQDECFVCGQPARTQFGRYGHQIYRPGLRWNQLVCDDYCRQRADRWPRQWPANLYQWGKWTTEYPKWPMKVPLPAMAQTDQVREWLARRGIIEGRIPPGDTAWWRGHLVEVLGHIGDRTALEYSGYHDQTWHKYELIVPAGEVNLLRQPRMLAEAE